MKMKGSALMKVSAVLCVIFGALSLAGTLISIPTDLKLAGYGASSTVIVLTVLFGLLGGAVFLYAGRSGSVNPSAQRRHPSRCSFWRNPQ